MNTRVCIQTFAARHDHANRQNYRDDLEEEGCDKTNSGGDSTALLYPIILYPTIPFSETCRSI